ncbi:MAG: TRAP transporter small permease [Planctomycetales bacterium]|nr:TRAP transporter small permease [Planctomycetales bacterium]
MQKVVATVARLLESSVTLCVAILVLDVLWGVISRFVLAEPSRWTEELAQYLLMWVALLGAAVGFQRGQHLGLDYFVQKMPVEVRSLVGVFGQICIIAFASLAMIWGGYVLVSETLKSGQVTPALEIHMGWVYLAVPISGVAIAFFSFARALELIGIAQPKIAETNELEG